MVLTSSGWLAEFPTPSSTTWSHACDSTGILLVRSVVRQLWLSVNAILGKSDVWWTATQVGKRGSYRLRVKQENITKAESESDFN